jgi:hypothetical protein
MPSDHWIYLAALFDDLDDLLQVHGHTADRFVITICVTLVLLE